MKDNKELILGIIGIVVVIAIFIASNVINDNKNKEKNKGLLYGIHYAEIKVKDYGSIVVELDADKAPITVTNFLSLADSKFYDGLTFHRIIDGFMIQGGGYDQNGNKKNADTIKGEFSTNGIKNDIKHERGVISMARVGGMNNSASSEFFIMHEDNSSLDGNYAAFGHVIEGMNVVDKIATTPKPTDDNGYIELEDRPVIESIRSLKIEIDNTNYEENGEK